MEIIIKQDKISIGRDAYDIFVEGQKKYRALTPIMALLELKVTLYDVQNTDEPIIMAQMGSITKSSDPFFKIIRNNQQYNFNTTSYLSSKYVCTVDNDAYAIYMHNPFKYSVYKNEEQIGWWSKKNYKILKGDSFTITCNSDCDIPLMAVFCLIFDLGDESDGSIIKHNVEKLSSKSKPFDENWRPK